MVRELLELDEFTPWFVKEIYPSLKERTLKLWQDKGIIHPAKPSQGTGYPARYSYRNLLEIGIALTLSRLGLNSHEFLKEFMRQDKNVNLVTLIAISPHRFNCFIALPEPSAFWQKLTEKEAQDYVELPPILLPIDDLNRLGNLFTEPPAGWILVDVRGIKQNIDKKLASLR